MTYPSFAVGDVLTASDMNAVGLWKITNGTLATATTNVTNCFSSAYTNYRLVINNVTISATGEMYLKFFTTGTTNPAGNSFYWMYRGYTSGGAAAESNTNAGSAGYLGWNSTGAGGTGSVVCDITSPNLSAVTTVQSHAICLNSTVYVTRMGGFAWDGTNTFTGFQIVSLTASTFTGSYALYGYRN